MGPSAARLDERHGGAEASPKTFSFIASSLTAFRPGLIHSEAGLKSFEIAISRLLRVAARRPAIILLGLLIPTTRFASEISLSLVYAQG
jgi:hypothetical protein